MRTQTSKLSIFLTAACAFGLSLANAPAASATAYPTGVRCEVAAYDAQADAHDSFTELTNRAATIPVRVVDLEYRMIKDLMKNTDLFHEFSLEISQYQHWNMPSQLVGIFEKRHGQLESVDPRVVSRTYSLSMRQTQLILEILADFKDLSQLDSNQHVSLPSMLDGAHLKYRNADETYRRHSLPKKVLKAAFFMSERTALITDKENFEKAYAARLSELHDSIRPLNRDVERSFVQWTRRLQLDAKSSRDERFLIENASDRIEASSNLITALNKIQLGNGQTYADGLTWYRKASVTDRAAWQADLLQETERKLNQLTLVIDRLELMAAELAQPPVETRAPVDEADRILQAKIRNQWAPLIVFLQDTAVLKFAVLDVQKRSVENGFVAEFLETQASRR